METKICKHKGIGCNDCFCDVYCQWQTDLYNQFSFKSCILKDSVKHPSEIISKLEQCETKNG